MKKLLFASAVSILLTACGSGAGSDSESSSFQSQEISNGNGTVTAPDSTNDSNTPDTTDPVTSTDPDNSTTDPVTNPEPTPTPEPEVQPVALYSYTNDVSSALPLKGATLEQRTVYIFWQGVEANSVTYYCCKGLSGDATGEAHAAAVTVNSAPYTYSVDLSDYSTAGTRELYVDYTDSNGTLHSGNTANFAVSVDAGGTGGGTPYTVDARLEWTAPDLREDGTTLDAGDIAYYGVLYTDPDGNIHNEVIDSAKTDWSITLNEGTYEFAIYATDAYGLKSKSSTLSCSISEAASSCI